MEGIRGKGNIQMLLTAEQEAQQIIANARNMKTGRMRQAKDEAERDAAAYRASLEEDFQRKVSETTGSSGSHVKRLEDETEAKIKSLNDAASTVASDVADMLMKQVTTVNN